MSLNLKTPVHVFWPNESSILLNCFQGSKWEQRSAGMPSHGWRVSASLYRGSAWEEDCRHICQWSKLTPCMYPYFHDPSIRRQAHCELSLSDYLTLTDWLTDWLTDVSWNVFFLYQVNFSHFEWGRSPLSPLLDPPLYRRTISPESRLQYWSSLLHVSSHRPTHFVFIHPHFIHANLYFIWFVSMKLAIKLFHF